MIIGVTGLMGVGKTTLCNEILKHKSYTYLNVDDFRHQLETKVAELARLKPYIYKDEEAMQAYKKVLYYELDLKMQRFYHSSKVLLLDWALIIQDDLSQYCNKLIFINKSKYDIMQYLPATDLDHNQIFDRLLIQEKGLHFSKIKCECLFVKDYKIEDILRFINDQTGDLSAHSKAYYQDNHFYNVYSKAEDYDQKIGTFLAEVTKRKVVFDAGCGSGKFIKFIEPGCNWYQGMDLSAPQLTIARQAIKKSTNTVFQGNLTEIPFPDNGAEVVISSWVLGTILDEEERLKALNEMKRICSGTIYLVENDVTGEYESIRGHDIDGTTQRYHDWLYSQGFKAEKKLTTRFKFDSLTQAKDTFKGIYSAFDAEQIKSPEIAHDVIIMRWDKDEK